MLQSPSPISAFIKLGRLKFLFETMVIVALGVTLAVADENPFDLRWYVVAMVFAWVTHLMTHYCNEYFDLDADRANAAPTEWTGGSRILVSGLLPPSVSLSAAFVLLFAGVGLLSVMPDTTARLLGVASMALAWFYTAPPLRFNYRGLGELAASAVSYALGPLLAYYLQGQRVSPLALSLIGIVFALQFLRLLTMNLFDSAGDRAAGKRTLAVVLGERRLIATYRGGQVLVYLAVALLAVLQVIPALVAVLLLLTAGIPFWVGRNIRTATLPDSARRGTVTFWASSHLPLCTITVFLGLLVDRSMTGSSVSTVWLGICAGTTLAFGLLLVHSLGRDGRQRRPATVTSQPAP
ncbi:prenyltransferase [Streptomyces paludis]|uniref:Prenyltransferase n=1 Tax=Streptomyces paludis TaxID=2282738 RepID=A0A345HS52_9ACTN|nr:prenyltransferase [Streptomyces paludis]AXG79526.1 prenyltransferase [Streptomyces paludis]